MILFVFAILGNILNFAYNVPLVYKVLKTKSTDSISIYFLYLRIAGSICWLIYGIYGKYLLLTLSYIVTLSSSLIILIVYYKNNKDEVNLIESSL